MDSNHKPVERIMHELGLRAHQKAKLRTTTDSCHSFPRYPNLVEHLEIVRPEQVWVSDITYIHLHEEFVCLAVLMDVCRLTRLIAKRGRNASVRELGDDMSQKNCKEKSLSDEDWPCFTAILSGLAQMATLGIAIWRFSRWTASEIAGMIFLAKKWST
jgi:hypothetical protein